MTGENNFEGYARQIWEKDPFLSKDLTRWHTSGYHIQNGQLSIEDLFEDAWGALDIITQEVGIPISIEEWQQDYIENPEMIAAMARTIYVNLRQYGRYTFNQEPDWDSASERFVREFLWR